MHETHTCARCGSPDFLPPLASLCRDRARWHSRITPEAKALERDLWDRPVKTAPHLPDR